MGFGYLCVYKVTTFARQFILRKNITSAVLRVLLPFTLGAAILYWMYRGSSWDDIRDMVLHRMQWSWMIVSLLFGILPQVLRGLRWRLALEPVGEKPRRATCVFAVFVSYAASLVVPRIGEITRCGTLLHHDGTSFPKSLGTVVTERPRHSGHGAYRRRALYARRDGRSPLCPAQSVRHILHPHGDEH